MALLAPFKMNSTTNIIKNHDECYVKQILSCLSKGTGLMSSSISLPFDGYTKTLATTILSATTKDTLNDTS